MERAVLLPGASTALTMDLEIPSTYDKRQVSCVVKTDHPDYPEWIYYLAYESFPQAQIVPAQIRLGTMGRDDADGGRTKRVAHLEVYSSPNVKRSPAPSDREAPHGIRVQIDRDPTWDTPALGVRRARFGIRAELAKGSQPLGSQAQPLNVYLDNGFVASTMIVWSVTGPVEVVPSHLHFGIVSPGGTPNPTSVMIRSDDGRPFQVLSVESDTKIVEVEVPDESEGAGRTSHTIKLTLHPDVGSDRRALTGSVRVLTDIKASGEVQIPWSAFVRRPGSVLGE